MSELKGRLVTLKTLEREHCRQLWTDYEAVEPLPTEAPQVGLSSEGAERWFEEIQAQQGRGQVYLGIFSGAGDLLGDIQLSVISWRDRTAELGIGISRAADRGRGYGRDAAQTLLAYAFDDLDLLRVGAHTLAYNQGACRLLESCGFVLEGRERQARFIAGQRWDRLVYGLLRAEWIRPDRPSA